MKDKAYLIAFGINLRLLRKSKGLTQEELANMAEVGKNQIGMIERGEINPTVSTVKVIARILQIHPKTLLDFE